MEMDGFGCRPAGLDAERAFLQRQHLGFDPHGAFHHGLAAEKNRLSHC
jgi:hypothetical protein